MPDDNGGKVGCERRPIKSWRVKRRGQGRRYGDVAEGGGMEQNAKIARRTALWPVRAMLARSGAMHTACKGYLRRFWRAELRVGVTVGSGDGELEKQREQRQNDACPSVCSDPAHSAPENAR